MAALMQGRKSRTIVFTVAGLVVAAVVAVATFSWLTKPKTAQASGPPPVPVMMTEAGQQDVPIYFEALGTVMALNTVSIRAQVNGQLVSIDFRQGQDVKQGDVIAKIDPAPFKATLDQAVAKKAQDEALLIDAQKDLVRFKTLVVKNVETQQNVDAQQAKVDQLKATIDADQAAIEAAQTQLDFTTIAAPIDGVVGFRQLDIGNIIHTTDANPLTVLTQIKPCVAVFTLPQDDLGPLREAMLRGQVEVLAFDQDDTQQLAQGHLLLIDNQIDQNTSTIRMKAEFPNQDERLWPGEFVRIRTLVTTRKDAVTVPAVAVQRGPDGLYAWVIKPDNTVEQRPIQALTVSESLAVVTKGLSPGEHVVTDGQSRLDVGTRVAIKPAAAASAQSADKS
jgi:membrane fusion protein, multidrug efflux system